MEILDYTEAELSMINFKAKTIMLRSRILQKIEWLSKYLEKSLREARFVDFKEKYVQKNS